MKRIIGFLSVLSILLAGCTRQTQTVSVQEYDQIFKMDVDVATHLAGLALNCVQREYPNSPGHVLNGGEEVLNPMALHPAFYGCFDWHSSVHGHWMLVRILKLFPEIPIASKIRSALNRNITEENIRIETAYLDQPNRKSFERTYGWAWLLKLAEELSEWPDRDGQIWAQNLKPLTQAIVIRYLDFLPKQTYPIRTGVHPNTAFGISFAFDYADTMKDEKLKSVLIEAAQRYFLNDQKYPAEWEPGGEDFFSAALMEIDLMRKVLDPEVYLSWLDRFLPGLGSKRYDNLLKPATVSDRSDPKIVHLDGLNLSRAWCMLGIALSIPATDPRRDTMLVAALNHAKTALENVASSQYEGEHWLGSFAVYLLSTAGSTREGLFHSP